MMHHLVMALVCFMGLVSFMPGSAAAAPVVAQPMAPTAAVVCGNTEYLTPHIDEAAQAACEFVKQGDHAGSSSYPHRYNNYEDFDFDGLSGPFYEFPILSSSKVYAGGPPGPDRIVIDESCRQAGEITHRGASGNKFVGCTGTD